VKHPFELVQSELSKTIGIPEDILKNLEKNFFPTNTDIKIPGLARKSSVGSIEDALNDIELSEKGNRVNDLD